MDYKDPEYKQPKELLKPLFPDTAGIQICCPNCGQKVASDDINIAKAIAKCGACDTVFSFEKDLKDLRHRPEIFMPEGIEMMEFRSELDITYAWRKVKPIHPFEVIFGIFWNAIVLPFAFFAIASGEYFMLLALSLHLTVGLVFLYNIITKLFNHTYITVDDYNLAIEHGPFKVPFFYRDSYTDVNEIKQLYVKKYVQSTTNGTPNYAYSVNVIKVGEEEKTILKGIKNKQKALYFEQEIERFLNIQDRKVPNEVD